MHPLTENQIRASFINTSQRERNAVAMPELANINWDEVDFLGWRDRKIDNVGYVVVWLGEEPVGVMLRTGNGRTRARPQCSWCEDVHLPNDVVFFSAKRAGQAGRNGNTVGTLVCAGFECSANAQAAAARIYRIRRGGGQAGAHRGSAAERHAVRGGGARQLSRGRGGHGAATPAVAR